MLLIDRIRKEQIEARKDRKTVAATLLTTLLGEANVVAKNAQREKPTDEEVQAVVKKFLKGNTETQEAIHKVAGVQEVHNHAYLSADVVDKLTVAKEEQAILESYLPKQLSEDELKTIIKGALLGGIEMGVGPLMGFLKARHTGEYDGKLASSVIKAVIG